MRLLLLLVVAVALTIVPSIPRSQQPCVHHGLFCRICLACEPQGVRS